MGAKRQIAIACFALAVLTFGIMPVQAQDWMPAAQSRMAGLEGELAQRGPARVDDTGALYFGAPNIGVNAAVANEIGRRIGAAFWLFRRDGTDFIAVATNMRKADGQYDVGGKVDLAAARDALLAGQRYYGTPTQEAGLTGKRVYGVLKAADGAVIGAYMILLSAQESCDRNLAPVIFPNGPRSLVSIDGYEGFDALRARIEPRGCNAVSISWAEGCNRSATNTRFGEQGEILDPIRSGSTTLLGCPDDGDDKARPIRAALFGANHWRIDPGAMLILEGPGHSVLFGPGTRPQP